MKKITIFLFSISLIVQGCSKYGYVRLKYPTAPEAVLPDNIHSLAVVNRSFAKKEGNNSVVESIATGEVAGSDRRASNECLRGVSDRISGSKRISVFLPDLKLYGTGTREIPSALSWDLVKKICDSTKTDALLVLETFDSNSDIILSNVTNQVNAVLAGAPPPPPSHQIRMNVVSLWRVYDPSSQKIVDQYQSTNYLVFDGGGALFTIPPPDALPQTAYRAGEEYIQRFLPGYYYVKRDMYKRGKGADKQQFSMAFRRSEVANWEGASEIWSMLTKSDNPTNAGRACLNMAVACEVLGQTEAALNWAKIAYENYGNKLARDYANILKYRLQAE